MSWQLETSAAGLCAHPGARRGHRLQQYHGTTVHCAGRPAEGHRENLAARQRNCRRCLTMARPRKPTLAQLDGLYHMSQYPDLRIIRSHHLPGHHLTLYGAILCNTPLSVAYANDSRSMLPNLILSRLRVLCRGCSGPGVDTDITFGIT